MRRNILIIWALVGLLAYCGNSDTHDSLDKNKGATGKDSLIFPMRINSDAGYLFVDVKGQGGIPIVFAHSFAGSAEHWKNQVLHYKNVRQVVTFDFRAHGRSDSASVSSILRYSPGEMAHDIATVVDFMKLKKFVLVGHSMGGSAAIAYASQHPEKIAALILAGTPGKSPAEESKKIMNSLRSPAYEKVMQRYMDQLLQDAKPGTSEMVMQEYNQMSKPVTMDITEAIFDYDPVAALKKYHGPLMIVETRREHEQPTALSRQVAGAKTVVIDGSSHWVQLDQPEAFDRAMDQFLEENHL
jgi:pimeloyl-ACP methyl ester carboxylesterase